MSRNQRLVQRDLANTLRLIRAHGEDGFYRGRTAAAIVKASRAGGGIIEEEDLASYKTRELAPLECDYRGYHLISAPPPSSGGVALCEMLNILEGYKLRELGWGSAQALALRDRGDAPRLSSTATRFLAIRTSSKIPSSG